VEDTLEKGAEELEDPAYLGSQLITYLGNKRALLGFIGKAVEEVRRRLGGRRLRCLDAFSGSGAVARYLKRHSSFLAVNDLEGYSAAINRCYLANRSAFPEAAFSEAHARVSLALERGPLTPGLIAELYAPRDDRAIRAGERVFFTSRNAAFIDTARALIEREDAGLRDFFLGPLLSEVSIHANTSGVFKGFHKDTSTGLGKFGGRGGDALSRIMGDISLPRPVLSRYECECLILQGDANQVCPGLRSLDLAYLDPPYNQHPYGSNYFMLNTIAEYRRPVKISPISGIPTDWRRSDYNRPSKALGALEALVNSLDAPFILLSFNSEGFIPYERMMDLLSARGRVDAMETNYNAFRGSRNLASRSIRVKEYLYLLERRG
jgi:adenine-specific DNA-methyltransferase